MKAFSVGADGVLIAGCHPGECHYIEQNYKALRRFRLLQHTLQAFGIEDQRVQLIWASAAEGKQLAEAVDRMIAEIKSLGPFHWRRNWEENGARRKSLDEIVKEHEEAMEVSA